MKTTLLAAAAVLALGIGSAFAGEDLATLQVQATPSSALSTGPVVNGIGSFTLSPADMAKLSHDTGSQQMPDYASIGVSTANEEAVMLSPASSNEGTAQTAGSLPVSLTPGAQGSQLAVAAR